MQNKGLLTTFTILFAMGCLYALSLTWVATGVESDAKEYANGNSDLEFAYLDSMASEKGVEGFMSWVPWAINNSGSLPS